MNILGRGFFSLPFGVHARCSFVLERCCIFNCSSAERITGWKFWLNKMEVKKKRSAVTSRWRPVNLQSQSPAGRSSKEASIHTGNSPVSDWCDTEPGLEDEGNNVEDSNKFEVVNQVPECASVSAVLKPTIPSNDVESATSKSLTQSQEIPITYYPRKSKKSVSEMVDNISNELNASDVPTTEELQHASSIEVDASLICFLRGKGGITQKRIEAETGARIQFPSQKDSKITVQGASVESITKALERIEEVLDEAVKSPRLDYSHFVSLPLAIYPVLVDKLIDFQNSILGVSDYESVSVQQKQKDLRIDKSIFIKPKTFHLTVLMLKLWNKERAAAAVDVLQNISSKVWDALEGRSISIRLAGLECMKGSPLKAGVLYAPVEVIDGEDRLLRACQVIIDAYNEAGLVVEKDALRKLKLHATVLNVRHREGNQKYDSFDARSILNQYGSEDWGTYVLREAHLSQRFAFDDDGYYHRCALIPFPEADNDVPMALEGS